MLFRSQQASVRKVKIAPNPNDGAFALMFDGDEASDEVEIRVINTQGVEVAREFFAAGKASQVKMDLRGMPAGIYQVLLRFGTEASQSFKMMIK